MPHDLLQAADRVKAASNPPTNGPVGSMLYPSPYLGSFGGLAPTWGVLEAQRSIPVDALRWPRSVDTYEDMRRDPQIQGLLASVFLPIRHMEWFIDPAQASEQTAQEISYDLGLPLLGLDAVEDGTGVDFDDHLRLALLAIALGFQAFEETGHADPTTGRYRLDRLDQRPASMLRHSGGAFEVDPITGELLGIQVPGVNEPLVSIDASRLVFYCWDREGANWAGRPLLYGLYRAWLLKDELVRGDVSTKRRFGGIPVTRETVPDVGPAAAANAARMAMLLRSGDGAGVNMPYGTELQLLGVQGAIPDAIASAEYHDRQMARAFMQMFAELGNTKNGSRALGATLMDHYALGVLAVAGWARKTLQRYVRRIVDRNDGIDAPAPRVGYRHEDAQDYTSEQLVGLIESGAIVVDDDLEATIRERGQLPPRNLAEPGRTPPGSAPAASIAASGRRAHRHAVAAAPRPPARAAPHCAALQQSFTDALDEATATWRGVQAAQIDDLVAQVQAASSVTQLAAVIPSTAGAALLAAVLARVLEHGAQTAIDEAAAQGAVLATPDLTAAQAVLAAAADGTATLLARSLGQSAASKALAMQGQSPEAIGGAVRAHLEGLAGTTAEYELAGLITHAQNEGRFAVLDTAPDGTTFYASELNDSHTCGPCQLEDDSEFPSMAEARRDYPAGGYVACEGGKRCRGTVVATYDEA